MIDMNKSYKTRDGGEVRVLCVDREGTDYPVVTLINNDVGTEVLRSHTGEGRYLDLTDESQYDLIEIQPSVVFWVNVMTDNMWAYTYPSKKQARAAAEGNIILYDIIARRVELPIEEQE